MEKIVREKKTAVINLRVAPQMKSDLQELAKSEGISVAKLIGQALDEYASFQELRRNLVDLDNALIENGIAYDDDRKLPEIGLESLVGVLNGVGVKDGDQLVKLIELARK